MQRDGWRRELLVSERHRIITNLTERVQRLFFDPEISSSICPMVERFEENIYTNATSKSDYLSKIHLKKNQVEMASTAFLDSLLAAHSSSTSRSADPDLTDTSDRSPPPPNKDATTENEATGEPGAGDKVFLTKRERLKALFCPGVESALQNIIMDLLNEVSDDSSPELKK